MVKKLKTLSSSDDKLLAKAVRTSAQQIWQAGLGAFAKAQKEDGNLFAKLVKEGTDLQKRAQKMADGNAHDVSDNGNRMAGNVSHQESGSWDKLEQVFEDRVSRSLINLGVPTRDEMQMLARRIQELDNAVAALSAKKITATRTAAMKKITKAAPKLAPKPASKTSPKASASKKSAIKPAARKAASTQATARKQAPEKPVTRAAKTAAKR